MKKITAILNNYRECSRSLRNKYFFPEGSFNEAWDTIFRFKAIDSPLFHALVLVKVGKPDFMRKSEESIPFLGVVPNTADCPIMIERPSKEDRNKYWDDPVRKVSPKGCVLRFIDYFDFDEINFVDYQYYKVEIVGFKAHPHLVGREALVETHHADVVLLS